MLFAIRPADIEIPAIYQINFYVSGNKAVIPFE